MVLKFLGISFIAWTFATACFAVSNFVTPRDIASRQSWSNVKLKNLSASPKTIYGIYIRQMAYVTPGQSCDSAVPIFDASENLAVGAVVMPVTMVAQGETPVGKNYLYNMIYSANYYIMTNVFSTPYCALPGCKWGSDSAIYNWCIYLGALAPISVTDGYTANAPPFALPVSGMGFNYNVVADYDYIGPISCNDMTLTCSVLTPQSQSFS